MRAAARDRAASMRAVKHHELFSRIPAGKQRWTDAGLKPVFDLLLE